MKEQRPVETVEESKLRIAAIIGVKPEAHARSTTNEPAVGQIGVIPTNRLDFLCRNCAI